MGTAEPAQGALSNRAAEDTFHVPAQFQPDAGSSIQSVFFDHSGNANAEAKQAATKQLDLAALNGEGGSASTIIGSTMMNSVGGVGTDGKGNRRGSSSDGGTHQMLHQASMQAVTQRIQVLEQRLDNLERLEDRIQSGRDLGNSEEANELRRRYKEKHGKEYDPSDQAARDQMMIIHQQYEAETRQQLQDAQELKRELEANPDDPAVIERAQGMLNNGEEATVIKAVTNMDTVEQEDRAIANIFDASEEDMDEFNSQEVRQVRATSSNVSNFSVAESLSPSGLKTPDMNSHFEVAMAGPPQETMPEQNLDKEQDQAPKEDLNESSSFSLS